MADVKRHRKIEQKELQEDRLVPMEEEEEEQPVVNNIGGFAGTPVAPGSSKLSDGAEMRLASSPVEGEGRLKQKQNSSFPVLFDEDSDAESPTR